jgi:hypothetical protein
MKSISMSSTVGCLLSVVLVIVVPDWLESLLMATLVAFPPVAIFVGLFTVFFGGLPTGFLAIGMLFFELVRWVEAWLLRVLVVAVCAVPWPLPMEAASLGDQSELDPVIL